MLSILIFSSGLAIGVIAGVLIAFNSLHEVGRIQPGTYWGPEE